MLQQEALEKDEDGKYKLEGVKSRHPVGGEGKFGDGKTRGIDKTSGTGGRTIEEKKEESSKTRCRGALKKGSSGFEDPGGVSTRRSKGCRKISLEIFYGYGLFRWWLCLPRGFAMTVIQLE